MKKIKIISMILTVVMLVTSFNLGVMFTSNAADPYEINSVATLEGLKDYVENPANVGTLQINVTGDIDASTLSDFTSIDASGKTVEFYGGNKLIKNLNIIGNGLFSNAGDNSKFSNICMYNCTVTDFSADNTSGYGFIAGEMDSGSIKNCFADGSIAVYGDASCIGGLVGELGGEMLNSYAMADIYTNGSFVGGLVGKIISPDATVKFCYSTGTIDNEGYEYIGGLIGFSATSCISNSYTSTVILHPYADTVKSIGYIVGLSETDNVYYDKNLSLQRQGDVDVDPHRCTYSDFASKFSEEEEVDEEEVEEEVEEVEWITNDGYYPQLSCFYNADAEFIKRISAISAAVVDVSRDDLISTGREFTVVSSDSKYSYATLTVNDDSTINEANKLDWNINGGVDEYYFDPFYDNSNLPVNSGSTLNGLSGNTYDIKTGKYLFVNTGDVKFTAYSGDFERDIYVHVTTAGKNPYITDKNSNFDNIGMGTAEQPFIIDEYSDFDKIRLYCLDDETGEKYHYSLNFTPGTIASTNSSNDKVPIFDFSEHNYRPIIGMKGYLYGNGVVIRNLNVTTSNQGSIGLFATVTKKAVIKDIHISDAVINTTQTDSKGNIIPVQRAGILAGSVENATIQNVIATGVINNSANSGMIAGEAYGQTEVNTVITFGVVSGKKFVAGIFGVTEDNVKAIHCYSSAVVTNEETKVETDDELDDIVDDVTVGGFFASGGGDVEDSLFTGNLSSVKSGVRNGLLDTGTATNAYFDWQAAGILNTTLDYAVTTNVLISPDSRGIEAIGLDGDHWDWYYAGESADENLNRYPQLKHYSDIDISTHTRRTSNISALPFKYMINQEEEGASSISFTSAEADWYVEHGTYKSYVEELVPYPSVDGVGFDPGYDINIVGEYEDIFEVTVPDNGGGKQIYMFDLDDESKSCDTRYVMFNVKNINVHYIFEYRNSATQIAYNKDMHDKALTSITTGFTNKYNLFLDSKNAIWKESDSVKKYSTITFACAGDHLSFNMALPRKYGYYIYAYADKYRKDVIEVDFLNTGVDSVLVSDLSDIYIVFEIYPKNLPWGIYRLNTN